MEPLVETTPVATPTPADDAELAALTGPAKAVDVDASLTEEQRAKLAEMKTAVSDVEVLLKLAASLSAVVVQIAAGDREYWASDSALMRFLLARKWSVKDAAAMYRATMAFRIKSGCENVLSTYTEPVVARRFFPWGFLGLDKEGNAILMERIGRIDLIGMHASLGQEEFLRWVVWYHEVQERSSRRVSALMGKDRMKLTVIIDLGGLSMRHMSPSTLSVLKPRTRLEEDNYPEVVKRVFLINTPPLFSSVWGIVKRFMDDGTVEKFQILGSNYLPTLLKFVDASAIPAAMGGTLRDAAGDPECRMLVPPGGMVPPAYALGVATDGFGAGEEVNVSAGKHADVLLRAPAGATVHWRWAGVDKGEVNFRVTAAPAAAGSLGPQVIDVAAAAAAAAGARSVCGVHQLAAGYVRPAADAKAVAVASTVDLKAPVPFTADGAAEVDAVPSAKVDRHFGAYTVPAAEAGFPAGAVIRLRFDNSFSWMTSKTLVRRIDVLLPGHSYPPAPGSPAANNATAAVAAAAAPAVGGAGAGAAPVAAAAPAGAPSDVLIEADPLEAFAAARMQHMATFGLPSSSCWATTSMPAPAGVTVTASP